MAAAAAATDLMKYFWGFDCDRGNIPNGLNQNRLRENDIHLNFFCWMNTTVCHKIQQIYLVKSHANYPGAIRKVSSLYFVLIMSQATTQKTHEKYNEYSVCK